MSHLDIREETEKILTFKITSFDQEKLKEHQKAEDWSRLWSEHERQADDYFSKGEREKALFKLVQAQLIGLNSIVSRNNSIVYNEFSSIYEMMRLLFYQSDETIEKINTSSVRRFDKMISDLKAKYDVSHEGILSYLEHMRKLNEEIDSKTKHDEETQGEEL